MIRIQQNWYMDDPIQYYSIIEGFETHIWVSNEQAWYSEHFIPLLAEANGLEWWKYPTISGKISACRNY